MNKEYTLNKIFEIFNKSKVILVILFGNRNGSDTDIFLLLDDDSIYNNTIIEDIDITHIGIRWTDGLMKNLDPILTEPLLTGEVIFGDLDVFENLKTKIKHSNRAPIHLYQSAVLFYEWTLNFINHGEYKKALINISFIYSYLMFSKEYATSDKILTYQDISNKHPILKETKNLIKKHDSVTKEEIFCLMKKLKSDLTKTSNSLGLT